MAKGNLFLGTASGKLGSVVFYRTNGEQKSRVRVTSVSNPKTTAQTYQRIILTNVSKAYSYLQEICNHSFQGKTGSAQNQARFMKLNLDLLRQAVADGDTSRLNFLTKENAGLALPANPYYISEGTLHHGITFAFGGAYEVETDDEYSEHSSIKLMLGSNSVYSKIASTEKTYQDVCDALGIQYGDQLTFVAMKGNGEVNGKLLSAATGITYARIIFQPAEGDASTAFFKTDAAGTGLEINSPSSRNLGSVTFLADSNANTPSSVSVNGIIPELGMAVILSRKSSTGTWLRSTEQFWINTQFGNSHGVYSELASVLSSYVNSTESVESEKYLNNATA